MELFETAIKYDKVLENGTTKSTTENYLLEAVSHADAEVSIVAEVGRYVQGNCDVTKVRKVKFAEIITTSDDSADEYWKVNMNFIVLDEKSGAEKKTPTKVLVQCHGYHDCIKRFDEAMKGSMVDFEVAGITKTKYLDLFKN